MLPNVNVVVLDHGKKHYGDAPLKYAREGDAGVDLKAAIPETLYLAPKSRALVPTGIKIELPDMGEFSSPLGIEAQVRPRSGLALKDGISVTNAPGTIDQGYRGGNRRNSRKPGGSGLPRFSRRTYRPTSHCSVFPGNIFSS